MLTNIVGDILLGVEKFCKKNNIFIFYGKTARSLMPIVLWTEKSDSDWQQYVEVLNGSGVKLLTLVSIINDYDEEMEAWQLEDLNELSPEDLDEGIKIIEEMKATRGFVSYLSLHFYKEGVCYQFEKRAEWASYIPHLDESRATLDAEGEREIEYLDDEEVEEKARLVMEQEEYQRAKPGATRQSIALKLIREQGIQKQVDEYAIANKALEFFKAEIYPQQMEAKKAELEELRKIKKNIGKDEAKSKLGISKDELLKIW